MHRCFFALRFPPEVDRTIANVIDELRGDDGGSVRWTRSGNLHLTLRFLGELDDEAFDAARDFISGSSFGEGLCLRPAHIDAFPSLRKPSIIVATVKGCSAPDDNILSTLHRKTEEFAGQIGLEPDDRPFHPHVTLGRVKRDRSIPPELHSALSTARLDEFGVVEGKIGSIVLMESMLKPDGPAYTVAAEAELD